MEETGHQDPSALTNQALLRAFRELRDQFTRENELSRQIVDERFAGIDEATKLLQLRADRVPSESGIQISALKELIEEKFRTQDVKFQGISQQFADLATRTSERAVDTKTAVDAALQAAKEAALKSETGGTKLMDQLGIQISTAVTSLEGKLGDMKDVLVSLMTRAEADARFKAQDDKIVLLTTQQSHGSGRMEGVNWLWGAILGAISVIIAIAALFLKFN